MAAVSSRICVNDDVPGGNIRVEALRGNTIRLRQDRRDTPRWWFYWACRITGAAGKTLRFIFTDGDVCSHHGPAVSWDDGANWDWLGSEGVARSDHDVQVDVTFPGEARTARMCLSIPYTQANLHAFLRQYPAVALDTLCRTAKGRAVEMLTCGCPPESARGKLLLTARHHACEMIANYVMEGVLQAALETDSTGRWYQENMALLAIPFVDKDGVEDGDQGKGRTPRDHNRDYSGISVHRETAAMRKMLPDWIGGTPAVTLDLHCPYIRGDMSTFVYTVGNRDKMHEAGQRETAAILERTARGPWTFRADDLLPFGKGWNTDKNWTEGKSCTRWMSEQPTVILASSLEIPYSDVYGVHVTREGARAFGHDLARALKEWVETNSKTE